MYIYIDLHVYIYRSTCIYLEVPLKSIQVIIFIPFILQLNELKFNKGYRPSVTIYIYILQFV